MVICTCTPWAAASHRASTTSGSAISSFSTCSVAPADWMRPSRLGSALVGLHTRSSPFGGVIAASAEVGGEGGLDGGDVGGVVGDHGEVTAGG